MKKIFGLLMCLFSFGCVADIWVANPELDVLVVYKTANLSEQRRRTVAENQEIEDIGESGDFWQVTVDTTDGQRMTGFIHKEDLVPLGNPIMDLILASSEFKWIEDDLYVKVSGKVCFVLKLQDLTGSQHITEWKNAQEFFDETQSLRNLTFAEWENCEFPEDEE
ncbi:MAG: hypothetical protein K0U78_14970 [Actinomycetia bacterium]|nr:hypothetical protein [Actinomycetes bacterium]